MGLKRILFAFVVLLGTSSCVNPGTEVLSPPAPSQPQKPTQIITESYEVRLALPPDWTFTEYGPGTTSGADVFTDLDPATITVAHFTKGQSRFTVFYSTLPHTNFSSVSLFLFVRARHPNGVIKVEGVPGQTNAYFVFFDEEPFLDVYLSIGPACLWMRLELVGSPQEQQQTLQEFGEIVGSIEFVLK